VSYSLLLGRALVRLYIKKFAAKICFNFKNLNTKRFYILSNDNYQILSQPVRFQHFSSSSISLKKIHVVRTDLYSKEALIATLSKGIPRTKMLRSRATCWAVSCMCIQFLESRTASKCAVKAPSALLSSGHSRMTIMH